MRREHSTFPITISQTAMNVDMTQNPSFGGTDLTAYTEEKALFPYDPTENSILHNNVLSTEYMDYLEKIDPALIDGISYTRTVNMNMLKLDGDKATTLNKGNLSFSSYPSKHGDAAGSYLEQYYDLLEGSFPTEMTDLVLIVDEYNRLDNASLDALGIKHDTDRVDFNDLIGYELKLIKNDDYYVKNGEQFTVNGNVSNLIDMYNSDKATTLKIVGVIRGQEESKMSTLPAGVAYSDELATYFIEDAKNSEIVKAQQEADYNVITGELLSQDATGGSAMAGMRPGAMPAGGMASAMSAGSNVAPTKDEMLATLGATEIPASISLYPVDFGAKEKITTYLDEWNKDLETENKVVYTDMAAIVTRISGGIMDGITMVLVAFAAISLVVSLIMIGIITYISVMERTKEIGVLRALGARKKDITRVFNAETFIIGACSGLLGIGVTYLLTFPVNAILYNLTELSNVAQLNPIHALSLGIISVVLTMIGGFIPAKMAAKKDPVTALRSE